MPLRLHSGTAQFSGPTNQRKDLSGRRRDYWAATNFTHTGEGTASVWPVGFKRPVF